MIHGLVTTTVSKFSPQIFETYLRLYGRVTNYTIGSSIFCKLHPRAFDFFNFYTSGTSVLQKIYSRVVKNRNFLYFRVRGKAQHSDPPPPVTFYWKSPPAWGATKLSETSFCSSLCFSTASSSCLVTNSKTLIQNMHYGQIFRWCMAG